MDAHQKIFSPLAKQIEFFSRAQNLTCCDGLLAGLWRFKWSLSDYRLSTVNLLLCGFTITEEKTNKASQSVIGASKMAMRGLRLWVTGFTQSETVPHTGSVETETNLPSSRRQQEYFSHKSQNKISPRCLPVGVVGDNLLCKWNKMPGIWRPSR